MGLPYSVCLFDIDDTGRILCISRKEDPKLVGLIGGKVDPEDYEEARDLCKRFPEVALRLGGNLLEIALRIACRRETLEEAGLQVALGDLERVFEREGSQDISVTYRATRFCGTAPQRIGEGQLHRLTPAELLARTKFPVYNSLLLQAVGLIPKPA